MIYLEINCLIFLKVFEKNLSIGKYQSWYLPWTKESSGAGWKGRSLQGVRRFVSMESAYWLVRGGGGRVSPE